VRFSISRSLPAPEESVSWNNFFVFVRLPGFAILMMKRRTIVSIEGKIAWSNNG